MRTAPSRVCAAPPGGGRCPGASAPRESGTPAFLPRARASDANSAAVKKPLLSKGAADTRTSCPHPHARWDGCRARPWCCPRDSCGAGRVAAASDTQADRRAGAVRCVTRRGRVLPSGRARARARACARRGRPRGPSFLLRAAPSPEGEHSYAFLLVSRPGVGGDPVTAERLEPSGSVALWRGEAGRDAAPLAWPADTAWDRSAARSRDASRTALMPERDKWRFLCSVGVALWRWTVSPSRGSNCKSSRREVARRVMGRWARFTCEA